MTTAKKNGYYDLPTLGFKDEIINTVDQNQVVILTAETGAGKSTQVPQYLAEHGYERIIVTQPRILAARNLTMRVREEWAERNLEDSSEVIGYRTAHERDDSGNTKILYCTDGLQLVREITGVGIKSKQILVLDEVHEWNENMEVLVAWAKKRAQEEPGFKVLIMSATIETASLAEYFNTDAVIEVPGRYFEVKKRLGTDVISELFAQLENPGRNILTFLPGKAEIQDVSDVIGKRATEVSVPVIPLHSQLEAEMQQKVFAKYPNGKIILSTNIAQTSVTIDDIDMVIDSGLERRSEVRSGVEGLFISQISQADSLQRAGRAGRTKPGEYVLAAYDNMPCLPFDERDEYAVPEILRKHIDRVTLRLANIGLDIEMLDFYHSPSKRAIKQAKRTLGALGALSRQGEVTNIGRQMERFPVESKYARMMVESLQYSKSVQAKLAAIIAIQEVGGIIRGGTKYTGWRKYTRQTKSDLLAQYDVYLNLPDLTPEELEEEGIIVKNIVKAEEVIERLHADMGFGEVELGPIEISEEQPLMKSIVAGQVDQLWSVNRRGELEHVFTGKQRELSGSTVVKRPSLLAGTPFDLEVPTKGGGLETLKLVTDVTAVNTQWLLELSPEVFSSGKTRMVYDPRLGCLAEVRQVRFGKRIIEGNPSPVTENSPKNQRIFVREYSKWAHGQLEHQRRRLSRFYGDIPRVFLKQVEFEVRRIAGDIISLDQLDSEDKRVLVSIARIESYVDEDVFDRPKRKKYKKQYKGKRGRRH